MSQAPHTATTMARSVDLTREAAEHAITDPEDLNQFRDKMNAYLRSEVDPEFFSHWNVIPSPFVVDEAECRGLFDQAIALHDAVEFVLDAYMDGQPEVRALYDRYDVLSDEFSKCAATWQGWGRYDFLLSDGARPVFIETNAAMASGMLPMNYLNEFYRHHVPEGIAPGGERVPLPYDDFSRGGEVVLQHGRSLNMNDGCVAILIDGNKKFHEAGMLVKSLHAAGCESAVVASMDDVTEHDGRLWVYGEPIALAFMKVRLFGAVHKWSAEAFREHGWFFDAVKRGELVALNCLAAETLAEDKIVFAAMRLKSMMEQMDDRLRHVVDHHTVPTYPLEDGPIILDGQEVDLVETALGDRGNWMLKPRNDYRGSGVTSGRAVSAEEWEALLRKEMGKGDYLLQQRVDHVDLPVALPDGRGAEVVGHNLAGGVYVAAATANGIVARAGAGEVVNGITGAWMLPVWCRR